MTVGRLQNKNGFTLIELLVVISIIGVLSVVIMVGVSNSRERSRDVDRQADLRTIQTAVESYKQRYGRYPAMASSGGGCAYIDGFATESNCYPYIVGLEPFLSRLPRDPNLRGNEGYGYVTNTDGTVYKIIAMNTVEGEVVNFNHAMPSCDPGTISAPSGMTGGTVDVCQSTVSMGNPSVCSESNTRFQRSYAVWGGYATKTTSSNAILANDGSLDLTQQIICR